MSHINEERQLLEKGAEFLSVLMYERKIRFTWRCIAQKCSSLSVPLRTVCWPLYRYLSHCIIASDWKENDLIAKDLFCHKIHLVDHRMVDSCLNGANGVNHGFRFVVGMGEMEFIRCNHSMYSNATTSFSILEASGSMRFYHRNETMRGYANWMSISWHFWGDYGGW